MHDRLMASLAADLETIALLGGGDTPVPSCPGWTLTDLCGHVGGVARMAAACVRGGDDGSLPRRPRPEAGFDPSAWVREGAADLLGALRDTPADVVVPTFAGPEPASWWCRRQAVEMAVHRVDAQVALGRTEPVDHDVATEGIEEFLDLVCGRWKRDQLSGFSASVHLHATDGGEWTARWAAGDLAWSRSHDRGDVAVRATASDLLLLLWQRPTLDRPELHGDATVLEALVTVTAV